MNGIVVDKSEKDGLTFWTVRDTKTHNVLAVGSTAAFAVSNYETALANEQMAQELGISLDDLEI